MNNVDAEVMLSVKSSNCPQRPPVRWRVREWSDFLRVKADLQSLHVDFITPAAPASEIWRKLVWWEPTRSIGFMSVILHSRIRI